MSAHISYDFVKSVVPLLNKGANGVKEQNMVSLCIIDAMATIVLNLLTLVNALILHW